MDIGPLGENKKALHDAGELLLRFLRIADIKYGA